MTVALCAMFCLITCVYVRYHISQVDKDLDPNQHWGSWVGRKLRDEVYRLKDRFHNLCNDAPWKSLSPPDKMWLEVVEGKVDGHSTRLDTLQGWITDLQANLIVEEKPHSTEETEDDVMKLFRIVTVSDGTYYEVAYTEEDARQEYRAGYEDDPEFEVDSIHTAIQEVTRMSDKNHEGGVMYLLLDIDEDTSLEAIKSYMDCLYSKSHCNCNHSPCGCENCGGWSRLNINSSVFKVSYSRNV